MNKHFSVIRRFIAAGTVAAGLAAAPGAHAAAGDGKLLREYWAGLSGTSVSALTNSANYPGNPTATSYLTSFEAPRDVADNYGQRVRGYVQAPATGTYTFWLGSDDGGELWLSTDASAANKAKIATVSGWTNALEFDKYPSQTSANISLVAGQWYYVEALHKEAGGGDNLAVAWRVPGGSRAVIPGSALASVLPTDGPGPGTTYYYVAPTGSDAPGRGTADSPFQTLAYAATQVPAGANNTIYLTAGTYVETRATVLPLGVNVRGAGEASTLVTAAGALPAPNVDQSASDWKLRPEGSLIQLTSPAGYGANLIAAADGNQTLSGFTLDGHGKTVKAGVWVLNRNNVTLHDVAIRDFQQRGAVFTRGDLWWGTPLPDGKWMQNTAVYNCTFTNSGADISGESLGNLCLGGLDGADLHHLTVNENQGYGIKFMHVGHFRNVRLHDCFIRVPEYDAAWGEDIAIELWNLSYGNEIYNIDCNTWFSLVNQVGFNDYQPTPAHPSNVKVRNVRMVDLDGASSKESIESALSGVEISDCYFQDKGFGVAVWGGSAWGGSVANHDVFIHHNVFANVRRTPAFGFGSSAAVFVPDAAANLRIYHNVFDRLGNALQLNAANGVDIKNNVFLNTAGDDVQNGANLTFANNLKDHANPGQAAFRTGGAVDPSNLLGNPGFRNAGDRWDTYYQPASAASLVVDRGANLGAPYAGNAPDIGRWECSGARALAAAPASAASEQFIAYPNPTTGVVHLATVPGQRLARLRVLDAIGHAVLDLPAANPRAATLDLTRYGPGLYVVRAEHESGLVLTQRLVVR